MHACALLLALELAVPDAESCFQRGESSSNGRVEISDAIFTLRWLFVQGEEPSCLDAADADDSGAVNITDAIFTLNRLFVGGGPFPPPTDECGRDPTDDGLGCRSYPPCSRSGCDGSGSSLTVTVTGPGAAPIAGATLHVAFLDDTGNGISEEIREADTSGRTVFEKPGGIGEIVIAATAPGYQVKIEDLPPQTVEAVVRLEPAVPVAGTVTDAAGQPVAGARVIGLPLEPLGDQETESSAGGRFLLDHLPPGTTHLAILHPSFAPAFVEVRGSIVDVSLEQGLLLKITVTDAASGDALRARARIAREPEPGEPEDRKSLESREELVDGTYEFAHLNSGTYLLQLDADGYLRAKIVVVVVRDQEVLEPLQSAASDPLVIRVVDPIGQPIAHAGVAAYEPSTSFSAAGSTDGDGTVNLYPVPKLPMLVHAVHADYLPSPLFPVPASSPPFVIVLDPDPSAADNGTLTLRLIAPDGAPVKSHWAVLSGRTATVRAGSAEAPERGGEISRSLLSGTYRVLVASGGLAGTGEVVVRQGEATTETIILKRGLTVVGRATGAVGPAVIQAGSSTGAFDFVTATADAEGKFTLAPVPAGSGLILQAAWPRGEQAYLSVPPGAPGDTLVVEFSPALTGGLELRLILPSGLPAAGVPVKLFNSSRPDRRFSGETGNDGVWKIGAVPTGFYTLSNALVEGGQIYWWPLDPQVLVLGNEVKSLTLETTAIEGAGARAGHGAGIGGDVEGHGGEVSQQPLCSCNWVTDKVQHDEQFCGDDRNVSLNGGKTKEREYRCQQGALIDPALAEASVNRPWRFAALGINYASAHAQEAASGTTTTGITLRDKCYYCRPAIKGQLVVKMKMATNGGSLLGIFASMSAVAAAAMSVSGDLSADFTPMNAAATLCGLTGPHGDVAVGKFQIPVPVAECTSDAASFSGSAGPVTKNNDNFSVILSGNVNCKVNVWGLRGRGQAKASTTAQFKINFAICEGACNHDSPGCPQENDLVLIELPSN